MRLRLWIAAAMVGALGLSACGPSAGGEMDKMVDIGTHSLHIRCIGKGEPTVVIDTGLGDPSERWYAMQAQIAEHTRVCAYDRAGYGSSEPGPMPRNSKREAEELRQVLQAANVRAPYVLVGHSLGGINAQVFAHLYPERVAGLVLLDPPPLPFIAGEAFPDLHRLAQQQTNEWQQAAQAVQQSKDPVEQAKASFLETLASENAALFTPGAAQIPESFGDVPLAVVGSGQPNPGFGEAAEAFQQFWIEQNRALATRSTRGTFLLAAESGHHLYVDAPDVVLDAVQRVLEKAKD